MLKKPKIHISITTELTDDQLKELNVYFVNHEIKFRVYIGDEIEPEQEEKEIKTPITIHMLEEIANDLGMFPLDTAKFLEVCGITTLEEAKESKKLSKKIREELKEYY